MNKVAKVLAVIALSIGVFIGVIFMLTSGLQKVANSFFENIKNGDLQAAYDLTDSTFHDTTSFEYFQAGVNALNLINHDKVSWMSRSMETNENGGYGELGGTISYTDGTSGPICMQFLKEDGDWRINFFTLDQTCAQVNGEEISADGTREEAGAGLAIPLNEELVTMAREALGSFSDAVNQGDFTDFYENTISEGWKTETSVQELNIGFGDFLTPPVIDMSEVIDTGTPVFGSPAIDEYGWLIVKGRYSSEELTIEFELDYTEENSKWALSGIAVSTR
ncbi:MAG: hypothetical protein WCW30_02415 [Candidatus Gracilibacteria bacterium]